jgi:hypothetical protein
MRVELRAEHSILTLVVVVVMVAAISVAGATSTVLAIVLSRY